MDYNRGLLQIANSKKTNTLEITTIIYKKIKSNSLRFLTQPKVSNQDVKLPSRIS
jgi:hypothetical protein